MVIFSRKGPKIFFSFHLFVTLGTFPYHVVNEFSVVVFVRVKGPLNAPWGVREGGIKKVIEIIEIQHKLYEASPTVVVGQ